MFGPGIFTRAHCVWTFRSVPRAGERFNDTWAGESWQQRTGVNVWGFLTVDVARGIVYMPFGAPSWDRYGGDRHGDNLFSTSLVAADANTGKYLWHFQVVHHDIWDADLIGRSGARGRAPEWPHDSRRRRAEQGGSAVPARSRDRHADLRRRGTSGTAERGSPRANVADTAVSSQASAPRANVDDAGRRCDAHTGARSRVPEADGGRAAWRSVPAGRVQPSPSPVSRQSRRRELGRHVVQPGSWLPVREHERVRTDSGIHGSSAGHDPNRRRADRETPRATDRASCTRTCPAAGASKSAT